MIQVIPFKADKEPVFLPLLARGLTDLLVLRFNAVGIQAQVNTGFEIKDWDQIINQPLNLTAWSGQELCFTGDITGQDLLTMAFVLYDSASNTLFYQDKFQVTQDKFLTLWEEHLQDLISFMATDLKMELTNANSYNPRMYTKSLEAFLAFRKGLEILSQAKNDRLKEEGLENLLKAVAYDPDYSEAADILLLFLIQNDMVRNFERCINILERLRQIASDHPRIPLVLAEVYIRWGNTEKAEQVLKELLRAFPEFVDGWLRLALLYHASNRLDDALEALKSILAFQPDEPTAMDLMGAIYAGKDNPELAEEVWLKTLEIDPERVNVLNNLALLAEENEDFDKAESFFQQAVQLNDNWWGAFYHYGSFCWRRERLEEALILLEKAKQLNTDNYQIFQNLGLVQINLGRYNEAQESLLQVLQLAPDNSTRRQTLQLLNQLSDPQIKTELRIRQLERIWVAGKRLLAVGALIRNLFKAKKHWYYWYLWGRILSDVGAKSISILSWLVGLRYEPGYPLLKQVGLHYWEKGNYRKALPILRKAYQSHKNDQETACAYLQTLVNLGEVEELQANVKGLSQLVKTNINQTCN